MFEITTVRGRTIDYAGTLYESDGTTVVTPDAGSEIRCKIGRRNGTTPVLDLSSEADTSNGSGMTLTVADGTYTLKIAQADTADLVPGPYCAEISLVDAGDSNKLKSVEQGVIHILSSLAGSVG